MTRKMDARALYGVGLRVFGPMHLGVVLAYASVLAVSAPSNADRRWVLEHGPMSTATRYRRVADLDRLREALEADGYELEDAEPVSDLVTAAQLVAP